MVVSIQKLGSPSALSLFASAETIPALVAAGAILAVTAAVFTYSEFKSYKEKKHKEKIEVVNGLYALHLKQIVVPHAGKIHGFPPIFQLIDNKYQSMHFTPEQVKDIGSGVTHGSDIALDSYRESVRSAIRKLKDSCVNHSDILIRALVKMVAKDKDTELANTVAHNELKEGILRQHYIQSELFGIELRSDEKITLHDSIFQNWIKNLSSYYLKSLSIEMNQQDDTQYSPHDFFTFLGQAKALLGRTLFGHSKEKEVVESELKKIRKVFRESGNFIRVC